jgi:hypothetical protein
MGCKTKAVGQTKCGRHARRDREIQQKRRDLAVTMGLCTKCSLRTANKSMARCRHCAKMEARYNKERRKKKAA